MKKIMMIFILLLTLIYEKAWRPIVCKKKINQYINNLGGIVNMIKEITPRDEIYSVHYTVNGQSMHSNVKFNIFYKMTWE